MSLALILTAAVVAFICDVLKRNNEQLREMNLELKIRQEAQKASPAAVQAPKVEKPAAPIAHEAVAPPPATPLAAPKAGPKANKDRKRTVNSEALAAMERGAALAGSGGRPRSMAAPEFAETKPEPKPEPKVEKAPEVVTPKLSVAPAKLKKDWGTLLSRNAKGLKPEPAATIPAQPQYRPVTSLPAGFQDGFVLSKLVQSRQPVSGLVVSIGVNASRKGDRKLPESISKLVESLLGPQDFAAQSSEDEFLLIYPNEHGAAAQRRLSQIAQQLWDFQLRSLGSLQILFSWGGLEVSGESIEEAIASATERMQETKRGRKLLTMTPAASNEPGKDGQLRRAV